MSLKSHRTFILTLYMFLVFIIICLTVCIILNKPPKRKTQRHIEEENITVRIGEKEPPKILVDYRREKELEEEITEREEREEDFIEGDEIIPEREEDFIEVIPEREEVEIDEDSEEEITEGEIIQSDDLLSLSREELLKKYRPPRKERTSKKLTPEQEREVDLMHGSALMLEEMVEQAFSEKYIKNITKENITEGDQTKENITEENYTVKVTR